MKEEIVNAKIFDTMLGIEDHGIMTAFVYLDYGGSRQGFGGYALASGESMHLFVKNVLKIAGTDKWESLKGKVVRVKRESGWNGKIIAIGNYLSDEWFNPEEVFSPNK